MLYALACGTGAPIVYSGIYLLVVASGDVFGLESALPQPGIQSWVVGPGAAVMGGWMAWRLDGMHLPLPKRLVWGGLAGAGLGILNTPFTLGLVYVVELVRSAFGLGLLSVSELLPGVGQVGFVLIVAAAVGAPIAAPYGAVLGVVIALLCRRFWPTL